MADSSDNRCPETSYQSERTANYMSTDKEFMDAFANAGGDVDKLNSRAKARGSASWAPLPERP